MNFGKLAREENPGYPSQAASKGNRKIQTKENRSSTAKSVSSGNFWTRATRRSAATVHGTGASHGATGHAPGARLVAEAETAEESLEGKDPSEAFGNSVKGVGDLSAASTCADVPTAPCQRRRRSLRSIAVID
ncbi:hypothetical protein Q1695_014926 [Nippostrongylus brasiliensis]|nr:hypothetical protein Q1695_014926 [Nippostrongylus brasiliensis]